MHKFLLATASFACLAASAAQAATYIPVTPPPGATTTIVFGMNDQNIITGAYTDSTGVQHGFFGPLNGAYTTFDFGGSSTGTVPRAIGVDGSIDGYAPAPGYVTGIEFWRRPRGQIDPITRHHQPLDGVVQGINSFDVHLGDYVDPTGVVTGYFGHGRHFKKDFVLHIKGILQNSPRGINHDNAIAGFFIDADGAEHGFIQENSMGQNETDVIDYPGAVTTVLEDINQLFQAPGQWTDSSGNPHAFIYDANTGTFTDLDPGDGSVYQQAWSTTKDGLTALSTSNGVSYIYCPLPAGECPAAGADAKVHKFQVAAGQSRAHDAYGRTGAKRPPANFVTHGARQ
jgi:hypothetical protein